MFPAFFLSLQTINQSFDHKISIMLYIFHTFTISYNLTILLYISLIIICSGS